MAIKVVKKGSAKVTGATRGVEGVRSSSPRFSSAPKPASPVKWVVIGLLAFIVAVGLLVAAAVNQAGRGSSKGGGIRFVYGKGASVPRSRRDAITDSMGGRSMKEWCAENEKDNEMVQGRRARRKGR